MIHYYFDSLCDFIHRHYRIIAIAFNIILACTTLGIILNTYMYIVEYENTILYKALNDQNAHIKIAVPNACIIVFSISLIANLICDISYTITNKIKSSSAIYDLILANIFFLIGFLIPAVLMCTYVNNPSELWFVYVSTEINQNLQFASAFLILMISSIKNKYYSAFAIVNLFIYTAYSVVGTFPELMSTNDYSIIMGTLYLSAYLVLAFKLYVVVMDLLSKVFANVKVSPELQQSTTYAYSFIIIVVLSTVVSSGGTTGPENKTLFSVQYYSWTNVVIFVLVYIMLLRKLRNQLLGLESDKSKLRIINEIVNKEKYINQAILQEMLPSNIANDLTQGMGIRPETYECVPIFFSDIEQYTLYASKKSPMEVYNMINRLYKVMDYLVSGFPSLKKLETIGDAFVVVGIADKINEENDDKKRSFNEMVEFALLVKEMAKIVPMDTDNNVRLRIGAHCGNLVGGLTGYLNPRFNLFGDAMNCCARMEATGEVDKIHISTDFADKIRYYSVDNINLIRRETIEIKGKGLMQTWFLESFDMNILKEKHQNSIEIATKMSIMGTEDSMYLPFYRLNKGKSLKILLEELFLAPNAASDKLNGTDIV